MLEFSTPRGPRRWARKESAATKKRDARAKVLSLVLGLVFAVLAAEMLLRLTGFVQVTLQRRHNAFTGDGDQITVLCLGESSTALGGRYAYPYQLEELLEEHGEGRQFEVINGGMPGIDSLVIIHNLKANLERYQPDIVTVQMGINDGEKEFIDLSLYESSDEPRLVLRHFKLYRFVRFLARGVALERQIENEKLYFAAEEQEQLDAIDSRGSTRDYLALGRLYRRQGKYEEAEQLLLEALDQHRSPRIYCDLARIYHDMDQPAQEEVYYRAALEEYPEYHRTYRWMRRMLSHQGRNDELEPLLLQFVDHGGTSLAYTELAKFYRGESRKEEAEETYRVALDLDDNPYTPLELGTLLREQGRYPEAEEFIWLSLQRRQTRHGLVELARLQLETGRADEAEETYLEAIATEESTFVRSEFAWDARPHDANEAHVELARLLHQRGEVETARELLAEVAPNNMTFQNFATLVDLVMADVGTLVVLQYPVRSLEPLELMVPAQDGVYFVDNEKSFVDGIARDGFNAYFVDHYAGDFGHTSELGHFLTACNTAQVILEQVYQRDGLVLDCDRGPGAAAVARDD